MNKNNGNAAEQGGLRRGVAPPGGLLIDEPEPEQGGGGVESFEVQIGKNQA